MATNTGMTGIADYPGLGRARYTQAVLVFVAMFSTLDVFLVGLLLEPMKRDLGLSDAAAGLANTSFFYAAYGLFAIPMGMLADRLVRVRMLLAAALLWCGGLVLVGLSHDLWLLGLAKAVMGLASAITYPVAMSLLSDNFAPERRAFGTASYPMGQALGQGVALLVGGGGYSALVAMAAADPRALGGLSPWRAVPLIFAAISLLLVPAILAMREPARMEVRAAADAGEGAFRALWRHRSFLLPLFGGMVALSGMNSCIQTWFAPALIRLYHLQPGDFALPASIIAFCSGLVGLTISGRLINRTRARGDERGGMGIAALAAAASAPACLLATAPNAWIFAALGVLFLLAFGIAIAIPVIVIGFRIPNELRGLCMGLYVILLSVAGMIGAPLTGLVSAWLGGDAMLGRAMALVGVPCALLAALSFWIASRERPATDA